MAKRKSKSKPNSKTMTRRKATSNQRRSRPAESEGLSLRVRYFDGKGLNSRPHIYAGGKWQLADWNWHIALDRELAAEITRGEGPVPRSKWTTEARVRSAKRALEHFDAASRLVDAGDADAAALQAYGAATEMWRCRMMLIEYEATLGRHFLEVREMKVAERSKRLKKRNEKIRLVSREYNLSAEQTRRKFDSDRLLSAAYPEVAAMRRETISRIISGRQ